MKINEFRVNEGIIDLINKKMGGHVSNRESRIRTGAQDEFIRTFVASTQNALGAAIKSKMVDPSRRSKPESPESPEAARDRIMGPDNGGANEGHIRYNKLNVLFERLMEAGEHQPDTISSYVMRAFKQYMHGVDITAIMPRVKQIADLVQRTYPKDKGMAALKRMGQLGWAESTAKRDNEQPAKPAGPAGQKPAAPPEDDEPTAGSGAFGQMAKQLTTAPTPAPTPAAPTPAPAPAAPTPAPAPAAPTPASSINDEYTPAYNQAVKKGDQWTIDQINKWRTKNAENPAA